MITDMKNHIAFQMINSIDTPEYWGINLNLKYSWHRPVFHPLSRKEMEEQTEAQMKKHNTFNVPPLYFPLNPNP